MIDRNIPNLSSAYRQVFIVDTLFQWDTAVSGYESDKDLVLTFDFALQNRLSKMGHCFFVDHLVGQERMEKNNYIIYKFFQIWHNDCDGNDIFCYDGVDFGMSFRMDFWNDYTYYLRLYLCLSELKKISFSSLFVISDNQIVKNVLSDLEFSFDTLMLNSGNDKCYYFPIEKYMDDRIRPTGFRGVLYNIRSLVTNIYGSIMLNRDKVIGAKDTKTVFVQEYHPTKKLIAKLRDCSGINILLCNFSRNEKWYENLKERLLPLWGNETTFEQVSSEILSDFKERKFQKLVLDNGDDISDIAYDIILSRVSISINKKVCMLNACVKYLDRNPISLSVIIANIGEAATLFDLVCNSKGIPSYLIINGLLGSYYSDESKYATYINSYSESIKSEYFKGMDNIVVLGDPRMDVYPPLSIPRAIDRNKPTVVIGASGFSPVDLNSYVAVEFDFMFDVLSGIQSAKQSGLETNVIIKVRPNGYSHQYKNFVDEYFPELTIEIIDSKPMLEVLKQADLYISINSQTLFEASCLGIPVIYYKKDNEILPPPFNYNHELVTVSTVGGLVQGINDSINDSSRFSPFLDRSVMEKYIGPLDGNNLNRNLDFIYELIERKV